MASFTKKHCRFISSPMGDNPVTTVPGIGSKIGAKLEAAGIPSAKKLYSCYTRNPATFKEVIKCHTPRANKRHLSDAYSGMKDWDEQNN